MAESRLIQKQLAGKEDLLLGVGTVSQARATGVKTITKLNATHFGGVLVVDTINDLNSLDKNQLDEQVVFVKEDGNTYIYNGTSWVIKTTIVENIDGLKTLSSGTITVIGYYTKGDGGGGLFYWDSISTETDNGGTIIQAAGITTGRWKRIYTGAVNRKYFGTDTEWNNFLLSSSTTNNKVYSNTKSDDGGVSEEANFAGQGLPNAPIGWIEHHYTDGNVHQIDNVGDNNTIMVLKNAHNPIRRPDKPIDFVGTGRFLALLEHVYSTGNSNLMFYIDYNGKFVWTGNNSYDTPAKFLQEKADDGLWAYSFETANVHENIMNIAGAFQIATDLSKSRLKIDVLKENGLILNTVEQQVYSINADVLTALKADKNYHFLNNNTIAFSSSNSVGNVTQLTSKATTVEVNKISGHITTAPDSLAAGASVEFTMLNSVLTSNDILYCNCANFDGYSVETSYVANAAAKIRVTNKSGSSKAEAIKINFVIMKVE